MTRPRLAGMLVGAVCLIAACDMHPFGWKIAHMTPQSPRVQAILSKLEPHCFGRYLIDLPDGAITAWGDSLGLTIERRRAGELDALVKAKEDDRKSEERYPLTKHLNLYVETRNGSLPGLKHVISQKDFGSDGDFRINTYFALGDALVTQQTFALGKEGLEHAIAAVEGDLRRLRLRAEDEIPTEPGQCVEHGFMADRPNEAQFGGGDFLQVGFRLKDPPEVHLSIDLQPAGTEDGKPGLEKRLNDSERDARKEGNHDLYGVLTTFRRAKREVPAWKDGFEFLTKAPNEGDSRAHHDFWMIFAGRINTLDQPYVDIRLSDGVADNTTGRVDPALTDAEAIALWDALTETIRPRPTSVATAAAPEDVLLGARVVTGAVCPRTGFWECLPETSPVQGGTRRWFRAGDTMPSAVLLGTPTLAQRLRREAPSFASRTAWTLVSIDATETP